MCRMLSYLGKPVIIENLLYKTDNSFIQQSYNPRHMSHLLNLAGFGLMAWDKHSYNPDLPFIYRTAQLPFYDKNLHNLTNKMNPYCVLAHIRGVPYDENHVISEQNVHPFIFTNTKLALAHNGSLYDFEKMKYDLLQYIHPIFQQQIKGTTDSEWIYALFLSQLQHPTDTSSSDEIIQAILKTLEILQQVRNQNSISINSPINLFISNGKFIAATRFVFDYGWQPIDKISAHFAYHSLWYTYGDSYGYYGNEFKMKGNKKKTSIIIASEPLTEDTTTWVEVPPYTLLFAEQADQEIRIISKDIQL